MIIRRLKRKMHELGYSQTQISIFELKVRILPHEDKYKQMFNINEYFKNIIYSLNTGYELLGYLTVMREVDEWLSIIEDQVLPFLKDKI